MENFVYKSFVRPLLFQMDAEEAHDLGHKLLPPSRGLMDVVSNYYLQPVSSSLPLLETNIAGRKLSHPLGLAAGFDKNARLLPELAALGFSFAEVGSVTAVSSIGNQRPRIFRLQKDGAVINRLGLNGEGALAVSARLRSKIGLASLPLALNIAPSNLPAGELVMEEDIARTFDCFKDLPLTYITINTSCPNTHEGVLKESSQLRLVLQRVCSLNTYNVPLFLKLSPDAGDDFLRHTVELSQEFGIRGFVLGNTSTSREGLTTDPDLVAAIGNGGLSGPPVRQMALALVRRVARLKSNEQEIIACGGISQVEHVLDAIKSGARAVQIYTALIYEGPFHIIKLRRDLALAVERLGRPLQSLIGSDL